MAYCEAVRCLQIRVHGPESINAESPAAALPFLPLGISVPPCSAHPFRPRTLNPFAFVRITVTRRQKNSLTTSGPARLNTRIKQAPFKTCVRRRRSVGPCFSRFFRWCFSAFHSTISAQDPLSGARRPTVAIAATCRIDHARSHMICSQTQICVESSV